MAGRLTHDVRAERAVAGVAGARRVELTFGPEGRADERVPAVLLLPPDGAPPAPAAVLLHGFSSRKEQMADMVGVELLRHGLASLAIDLPLHGERIAGPATRWGSGLWERAFDQGAMRNPLALAGAWRAAQREARLAMGYLGARAEVDRERLAIVGYSMGSFLGVQVAADEPRARALVLAAGGDLPEGAPFARVVRAMADPLRAVRRFDGRPLLMVHGRRDPTVRPEQAQRLFDAALEPKELRWYDAGHYLPPAAIDGAATWLLDALGAPGSAG